jgi:hypothetical protein
MKIGAFCENDRFRTSSENGERVREAGHAKLANPTNDESDFAKTLRQLGFEVVAGSNLDRHGMDDAIREFGRKLEGADLALFFYAGHGLQVGGKNYLVPVDDHWASALSFWNRRNRHASFGEGHGVDRIEMQAKYDANVRPGLAQSSAPDQSWTSFAVCFGLVQKARVRY